MRLYHSKLSRLNRPYALIGHMPLKERVQEAINGSSKSKAEIARACGVTNAAVTHWISGDTLSMKADTALALENATGFRARWILYGKGTKRVGDPYWPFPIDAKRYMDLPDRLQGEVDGKLVAAIEMCEHRIGSPEPTPEPQRASNAMAETARNFNLPEMTEEPKRPKKKPKSH